MIKNGKVLADFESQEAARRKYSYPEVLKIFDAMWHEGISIDVLPQKKAS